MVRVIALVGPPASGKSTISQLFETLDEVTVIDTGDAMRAKAKEELDGANEDEIWEWVSQLRDEIGQHAPTMVAVEEYGPLESDVIVVSGLREQEESNWLHDAVGPTLVIRVDAPYGERMRRYVDSRIDTSGVVDRFEREQLETEFFARHIREEPYPKHHVTIRNSNDLMTSELMDRVQRIVEVIG